MLELHRRICADLVPEFGGRWRTSDVVVGDHDPPAHTLAFAEGRLLSIHPFTDFNGRVSRVFIDLFTRVLELPDVDPTPDPGEPTARYLAALRAADRNDWRPLMDIWRRRIEEALP